VAFLALAGLCAEAAPARAEERQDVPHSVAVAAGWFDFNRRRAEAAELRLEYRSGRPFGGFRPLGGFLATTDRAFFGYAGLGFDWFPARSLVITPSFAPGLYARGDGKDLGHVVEFRSQLEVAYRFLNRVRLGLSVSHISNASLGAHNPGTESLMINCEVPLRPFAR
jgi:hypothetical protein